MSYFQRRFDEAEELALAVESDARRWGDPWATLMMQTLLANLRLWTGRLADAEQFAERALAGFREVNDRYGVMQALGPLNRARAGLGKKADAKRGVEESIALGDTFGELGLALQAAAGVAMHLGQGELAVTLAEQVLERAATSGMSPDEGYVLLTLGRCQIGDADGALEAIEHVDVEDFPFGRSARALARAIGGDHERRHRGCRAGRAGTRRQLLRLVRRSPGRRHRLRPGGQRPGQPALARFVDVTGVECRRRRVRRGRAAAARPAGVRDGVRALDAGGRLATRRRRGGGGLSTTARNSP